jgi:hypothetical protein
MICYPLQLLGYPFDLPALTNGARMDEPKIRPECQLPNWVLTAIHAGKDASINDMLKGGRGFPAKCFNDNEFELAFDQGCQQEQRDLKTLNPII